MQTIVHRRQSIAIKRTQIFGSANLLLFLLCGLWTVDCGLNSSPAHAITDTYQQTFDNMSDGATVDGADFWTVTTDNKDDAMIEGGNTATGTGKALKLVAATGAPEVGRTANYGNLSPTWIEYTVKAGMGAEPRDVPTTGIAGVIFSSTGQIMATDGTSWLSIGKTYTTDTWYRIILKVDFSTHLYDIYCENAATPKTPFVPDKQNLNFIDPAVSSLSRVGAAGAYNTRTNANSLVDEVVVHYMDKIQFLNSPQTIVKSYPSSQIIAQLQSANSEPQTAWQDLTLELRSSSITGEFSLDKDNWIPIGSVTLPEGSQQISFFYKDTVEGQPSISVNEYPDRGWTDATQEVRVVDEGEFFDIFAASPQVAGKPFMVQITAKNSSGEPDVAYNGTVDVFAMYAVPTTGTKIITPDSASGFVNGVKDIELNYTDAGVIKIGVRDRSESTKLGYSSDVLMLPSKFTIQAGASQVVNKNFPITVVALNAEDNVTKNYQGPAVLNITGVNPVSTSGGALNPSVITAGGFEAGALTMNAVYNRWGTVNIKVQDQAQAEIKGETGNILFAPRSISINILPPDGREFFYTGENIQATVTVKGDDGLPIENFQGTLSLTPTKALNGLPAQYVFTDADKGQKVFIMTAGAAGEYKISVNDTADALSVQSEEFEAKEATIQVSNTSAPVGTTVVEVQLLDSKGKRIKDNKLTVTIVYEEENSNGSVFLSELGKPILFRNGVAKIVIGNTEAESVTISAKSKFGLKVINGKVVFGRAGASGVGTLMLRETKD